MCICQLEEIPAGISQNYRREHADDSRAAFPVVIIGKKADRQRASVALLAQCLVALSLLVPDRLTAVVTALLATLSAAVLLKQQSLGADLSSRGLHHD